MLINAYGLLTGVDTIDIRKVSVVYGSEVIPGLRIFPDNLSMTQGIHLDVGNDEDRILVTIAGDRIMIAHACMSFCLGLVQEFKGNVISVGESDGESYTLWVAPYDKGLFEQVTDYMIKHPHEFAEDEEPEEKAIPSKAAAHHDDELLTAEADYNEFEDDEDYDDNPSLWQRFKWWACDCRDRFFGWLMGDDDDYEDDYEDDEEDDKEVSYVDEDYYF